MMMIFEESYVPNKFNVLFDNITLNHVSTQSASTSQYVSDKLRAYYHCKDSLTYVHYLMIMYKRYHHNGTLLKSLGHDAIPAMFLKDGSTIISTPLAYIFNLSLRKSLGPDDVKVTCVVPLYKQGDRNDEGNYQPLSA